MARRTASRRQSPTYEQVRRLEKVEGGATVFYEVSRQGKWVMVRSGHVGLPGQTRMREYPTPPAASVAMERLVEDRLKEGWLEPSSEADAETSRTAPPDTRTVQSRPARPADEASEAQRATAPRPQPKPARTTARKKAPAKRKKKG
jgi:predicted DNA-binding WGR domain protein